MRTTNLVRQIMQIHGKSAFTNKYNNSRSVKCYHYGDCTAMLADIEKHLNKEGIDFKIKYTKGTRWGGPGIIVSLPL